MTETLADLIESVAEPGIEAVDLFKPEKTKEILTRVRAASMAQVFDITTKSGREECKSLAYKIARFKTTVDDAGKELVAERKREVKEVDRLRKVMRDGLDEIKTDVRAPLTAWARRCR
jgi:hypothetical protein